jgi:hypothetical protein
VAVTPIPLVMSESIEATQATNGVDAASNLAADVNAAVEALDNLKRLLWRQFPGPVLARLQKGTRTISRAPIRHPKVSLCSLPQ